MLLCIIISEIYCVLTLCIFDNRRVSNLGRDAKPPFFSLELIFYYFPVTQEIPFNFSMVNFSSSF